MDYLLQLSCWYDGNFIFLYDLFHVPLSVIAVLLHLNGNQTMIFLDSCSITLIDARVIGTTTASSKGDGAPSSTSEGGRRGTLAEERSAAAHGRQRSTAQGGAGSLAAGAGESSGSRKSCRPGAAPLGGDLESGEPEFDDVRAAPARRRW